MFLRKACGIEGLAFPPPHLQASTETGLKMKEPTLQAGLKGLI